MGFYCPLLEFHYCAPDHIENYTESSMVYVYGLCTIIINLVIQRVKTMTICSVILAINIEFI